MKNKKDFQQRSNSKWMHIETLNKLPFWMPAATITLQLHFLYFLSLNSFSPRWLWPPYKQTHTQTVTVACLWLRRSLGKGSLFSLYKAILKPGRIGNCKPQSHNIRTEQKSRQCSFTSEREKAQDHQGSVLLLLLYFCCVSWLSQTKGAKVLSSGKSQSSSKCHFLTLPLAKGT